MRNEAQKLCQYFMIKVKRLRVGPHHSLASDMVELDKLFGMTADAIEVR